MDLIWFLFISMNTNSVHPKGLHNFGYFEKLTLASKFKSHYLITSTVLMAELYVNNNTTLLSSINNIVYSIVYGIQHKYCSHVSTIKKLSIFCLFAKILLF